MMERAKQFTGARYVSLETFRRSGVPVRTVVWVVEDGGILYVRTSPKSGKVKRIRNDPLVRIAESNFRGAITGSWADGAARFVAGDEANRILGLFREKYGLQLKVLGWLGKLSRLGRTNQSQRPSMVVLAVELT